MDTKIHTPELMNARNAEGNWRIQMPLPSSTEIADLQIGDTVSIADRVHRERYWVIIDQINEGGFVGIVNNDLVHVCSYNDTDHVAFKAENIYMI